MKKMSRQKNRGFTLIETLVAISIFSVSILAMMAVLADGISDTNYVKKKIIATYLAQEGIEYMRNMRDTFVLYDPTSPATGFLNGFNSTFANIGCGNANGCYFDDRNVNYGTQDRPIALQTLVTACGASCPPLLYDNTTGKYGYVSGANSDFIRKVKVNQINADEIKISSTVFWTQGSGNYSVTLSENLFNWVE